MDELPGHRPGDVGSRLWAQPISSIKPLLLLKVSQIFKILKEKFQDEKQKAEKQKMAGVWVWGPSFVPLFVGPGN